MAPTITHLKCELIHAIYELLLDEEFMHAYEHGIVVKCADGITRRIFPRFFTYAADYPEKYVIGSSSLLFAYSKQGSDRNNMLSRQLPMSTVFYKENSCWRSQFKSG